jgi:hypothetical protein
MRQINDKKASFCLRARKYTDSIQHIKVHVFYLGRDYPIPRGTWCIHVCMRKPQAALRATFSF